MANAETSESTGSTGAVGPAHPYSSPLLAIGANALGDRPRLRLLVRLGEFGMGFAVALVSLHRADGHLTLAVIAIVVEAVAWLGWIASGDRRTRIAAALVVMAIAGGVAAAVLSPGVIFVGVAAAGAAFAFPVGLALAVSGPALVAFVAVTAALGTFPGDLSGLIAAGLLGIVSGGGRRQLELRGQQRMMIATAEQRADVARRETELIAERNRLGREIHDVLAHTLGAVSIQLTALDSRVAAGEPASGVRERIAAVHRLVGEGLGEARDAVRALREDGEALDAQLRRLCELHGARLQIADPPPALGPELTLTIYRVAQEALTNATKHAPEAEVSVRLQRASEGVEIRVDNGPSPTAETHRLAASGGGQGLAGLRERVRLAGGSFAAGPSGDGWQVRAAVPIP